MKNSELIELLKKANSEFNQTEVISFLNLNDIDYTGMNDMELFIAYLQAQPKQAEEEELTPEEWLEQYSESIARNVLAIDDLDEHICTFDSDKTVHGASIGIMEVALTESEYMMLDEDEIQKTAEQYVKQYNMGYDVNVSMCDDDKSVCITIEEPDFVR